MKASNTNEKEPVRAAYIFYALENFVINKFHFQQSDSRIQSATITEADIKIEESAVSAQCCKRGITSVVWVEMPNGRLFWMSPDDNVLLQALIKIPNAGRIKQRVIPGTLDPLNPENKFAMSNRSGYECKFYYDKNHAAE